MKVTGRSHIKEFSNSENADLYLGSPLSKPMSSADQSGADGGGGGGSRSSGSDAGGGGGGGIGSWMDSPLSHTLSNSHPRVLVKTRSLKNMRPVSGRFDEFSYEVHESHRALAGINRDTLNLEPSAAAHGAAAGAGAGAGAGPGAGAGLGAAAAAAASAAMGKEATEDEEERDLARVGVSFDDWNAAGNRSSSGTGSDGIRNRLSQHLAATTHASFNLRGSSKDGVSTTLTAADLSELAAAGSPSTRTSGIVAGEGSRAGESSLLSSLLLLFSPPSLLSSLSSPYLISNA